MRMLLKKKMSILIQYNLTLVSAVSSGVDVVFWNTTSDNVKSNGCLGTNTFLKDPRLPRIFGRPRILPRTIFFRQ